MTISEFIDKIYYGSEIEFKLDNTTYFIQGYKQANEFYLTVDYWDKSDGTEPEHDYLFSVHCITPQECVNKFIKAKLFKNKTIYEVEKDIVVIFGYLSKNIQWQGFLGSRKRY